MKLDQYKCLTCNKVHDYATHAPFDANKSETLADVAKQMFEYLDKSVAEKESLRPKPGDISVCSGCGTISIFQEDGDIRACTPEELVEFYDIDEAAYFAVQKMSMFFKSALTRKAQRNDGGKSTSEDQRTGGA